MEMLGLEYLGWIFLALKFILWQIQNGVIEKIILNKTWALT